MPDLIKKAKITQLLIAVNILVFIMESILNTRTEYDIVLNSGMFYTPAIIYGKQWYRLITSCFLHFGTEHLCSNMLSLIVLGPLIEMTLGHAGFLIIYLLAGLSGNVMTLGVEMLVGEYSFSVGASGAISGLMGAYIAMIIIARPKGFDYKRNIVIALICFIVPGFTDGGINVWAHIGGLIFGMIVPGCIFAYRKHRKLST